METNAFVRMRKAFETFADGYEDLVAAIRGAWESHGGKGAAEWQRFCDEEVGDARKRIPREVRKAIVKELAKDGFPERVIASALGMHKTQVHRDASGHKSDQTVGADGITRTFDSERMKREPKPHPEDEFKSEEQPAVDVEFFAMADAERTAELETWKSRAEKAEARAAELERLAAIEAELNEMFSAAAVLRAQIRKKHGEDSMMFRTVENLLSRVNSLMTKGD